MEKVEQKMRKIIFFDGVCHLCNHFVDSVISKDSQHQFSFAPLQGNTAKELLSPEDQSRLESVVLWVNGKTYYKSAAVIQILSGLGGPYKLFAVGKVIPRILRDPLYDIVAKNRYAWFGERNSCRLPEPHERQYLLD
ncbi:hypothetical protein BDW_08265 [Bdellovibrio bacteriovorus W]|nr:hypothetical protein BDW_08265 [Bdellovibrio bacteriovorus W]